MNSVENLQRRIKEESSKLHFEGAEDPVPELVEQLQKICIHEEVKEIDGFVQCTICNKQLGRLYRT